MKDNLEELHGGQGFSLNLQAQIEEIVMYEENLLGVGLVWGDRSALVSVLWFLPALGGGSGAGAVRVGCVRSWIPTPVLLDFSLEDVGKGIQPSESFTSYTYNDSCNRVW